MKKRRTYTRKFKIEALRLLQSLGKTQAEIERELGIGEGSLSRWKKEYAGESEEGFPGQGNLTSEEKRLRQLEREKEILRRERDILKEAVRSLHRNQTKEG